MFSSIKEILSSFRIKVSPEREISEVLRTFFKERNISIPGQFRVNYQNQTVRVLGDPYVSSYIKINNQEVLSYLLNKLPLYTIKEIL